MTVVFVHGLPETWEIWSPLREELGGEAVALALPGFGTPRPHGFSGTKDAYAEWLASTLSHFERPVDVVGHDLGALLTMRVASAFDVPPLRSWVADVANLFHPRCAWPERVHKLQKIGVGEAILKASRQADPDDPRSTISRLIGAGVPRVLARKIGADHDERMSQSILDFYRSAIPNVSAGWWADTGPTRSRGLVLLLPDPPEAEVMSLEVAERLGADTARVENLNHCWMAEAPKVVAPVLERFWASLN
jgi:pimeloyl-ACP methyl ester carboxylesterase